MVQPRRQRWRATEALGRAVVLAGAGGAGAVLLAEPELMVIAAPFAVLGALGLVRRPRGEPKISADLYLERAQIHEGEGTTSRLRVVSDDPVEQVTRMFDQVPHQRLRPDRGRLSVRMRRADSDVEISPRRWGRRTIGVEMVALTSPWAGFRWGPMPLPGTEVRVLPENAAYTSRAEAPSPRGLVGAHRANRTGAGTEFAGIRPFQLGDRLRRINWRVSTRTGQIHVTTTRAEQDAGVLLVVDATADHGQSGGVDGDASSLDLAVRAAAGVARHTLGTGDRVSLRVISGDSRQIRFGTGMRHLRRILETLALLRPAELGEGYGQRFRLRVPPGTIVLLFTPLFADHAGRAVATLLQRGVPTIVVDTLPVQLTPAVAPGVEPEIADLATRMRLLEREELLAQVAAHGCPVVRWRGPGTLDAILRRLVRHAEVPRMRV